MRRTPHATECPATWEAALRCYGLVLALILTGVLGRAANYDVSPDFTVDTRDSNSSHASESGAFLLDTRDSISSHTSESATFVFDTRDSNATHVQESGVFTFDTRAWDGLGGWAESGVFTFDTRSASGWFGMVELVQFTPASVNAGQNVNLSFRVRTPAGTPATTARLLLSADAIINAGDAGLSPLDVAVPALAAGGVFNYSGSVTVPAGTPPGAYYVGVWADPNRVLNAITPANATARSASRLTVAGTGPPALAVSPGSSPALASGSVSTFTIRNGGGGSLSWSAAISGAAWLHFISAASGVAGVNGSSLILSSDVNPGTSPRTGTITISAPGATPALQTVTVTQQGSAAAPAPVTSFVFSPIPSPQTVNAAFPVTITAKNGGAVQTAFNGQVSLRAEGGGAPSRRYANLVNGVWNGTVSMDADGAQTVLVASSDILDGRSGGFSVESGNPFSGFLSVRVQKQDGSAVSGANVTLTPAPSGIPMVKTSDLLGQAGFSFSSDSAFMLRVTKAGFCDYEAPVTSVVRLSSGLGSAFTVTLRDPNKPAVIFVPGIMGSRSEAVWLKYPVLPATYPAKAEELRLHDSPIRIKEVGWRPLKALLQDSFEVYEAPYDWRMPAIGRVGEANIAWRKYLLPIIAEAKRCGNHTTVDIVAHSTGGLLTRAYIQSSEYANDIGKLAMVATPNEGSANAYYLWFGGDTSHDTEGFYEGASRYNYEKMNPGKKWDASHPTQEGKMNFYRTVMKELEELLPVYDRSLFYLRLELPETSYRERESNPLYLLNQGSFGRYSATPMPDKVLSKVFYSTSRSTISQIWLTSARSSTVNQLYPHGTPVSLLLTADGDGTVRASSATMDPVQARFDHDSSLAGEHPHLVKEFAREVAFFLGVISSLADDAGKSPPSNLVSPTSQLLVSVGGRSQVWLLNPALAGAGVSPKTGSFSNDWTATTVEIGTGGSTFTATDPAAGLYQASLRPMPGEVVSVDIAFYQTNQIVVTNLTWIGSTNDIAFSFQINPAASNTLTLTYAPPAPPNPRCVSSNGLSVVAWDASPGTNVAGYRIYARRDDETLYQPLATTTNLSHDTLHPWMADGTGTNWFYAVVAVTADGTEGPYAEVVDNSAPTLANFTASPVSGTPPLVVTFTNTSSGGVTNWAWDFNSDGVIDSTEENPTTVFAEAGGYTVTLTVTGPEGTDTRVAVGFIGVSPPLLTTVRIMPDGAIGFDLLGQAGRSYDLQASTNLTTWTTLTNLTATNATTSFRDGPVTNQPWRFYRAVVP